MKRIFSVIEFAKGRTAAVVHKIADDRRNRGNWLAAVRAYDWLLRFYPAYDGARIQAAMCEDHLGWSAKAIKRLSKVRDPAQIPEAINQAGLVFKRRFNFAASDCAFQACYVLGHHEALKNLAEIRTSAGPLPLLHGTASVVGLLAYAEAAPLNFDALVKASIAATSLLLMSHAKMLFQLALLVAGTSGERAALIQDVAAKFNFVLTPETRSGGQSSGAESTEKTPFAAVVAAPGRTRTQLSAAGASAIKNGASVAFFDRLLWDDEEYAALMPGLAAAIDGVVGAVFSESGSIVEAAEKLADVTEHLDGKIPISLRDLLEPKNIGLLADRVLLNASRQIATRLQETIDIANRDPAIIAAMFAAPTHHSNAALAASGDAEQIPGPVVEALKNMMSSDGQKAEPDVRAAAYLARLLDDQKLLQVARTVPTEFRGPIEAELVRRPWISFDGWVPPNLSLKNIEVRRLFGENKPAFQSLLAYVLEHKDPEVGQRLVDLMSETIEPGEISGIVQKYPVVAEAVARAGGQTSKENAQPQPNVVAVNNLFHGPERIELIDTGWLRKSIEGVEFTCLSSVVAVRARVYSRRRIVRAAVRLNGEIAEQVTPDIAATDAQGMHLYYCNVWADVSNFPNGFVNISMSVDFNAGAALRADWAAYVDNSAGTHALDVSDAIIPRADPKERRSAVERVLALPSMVRPANRSVFQEPLRRVVIMRLDQLGDVATSMPAMLRIREILPSSEFIALVTPANKPLVETLGMFSEVVAVAFPYDHATRTRHLSKSDEDQLRARFAEMPVDLAVDLSPGADSRPVLKMLNARYLVGFNPTVFAFLDLAVEASTRDPINRREKASHTTMLRSLVESLGVVASPQPERLPPRPGLSSVLANYGLQQGRYIVLHSGARLAIKRWPLENFVATAIRCRQELGLPVVFFADDPLPATVTAELKSHGGIQIIEGLLPFDHMDALLSFAGVVVGNDTGPKHLAAVRGAKVVSIHMCQVNWNEWGQDGEGLIISRRTPCCGCGIQDPSECGKDLICLTSIKPSDVIEGISRMLNGAKVVEIQ
ncbi:MULTISPECIES: glycosyltransferase family 9 protein [unclassified Beijerinckia]|uniref:glycosyltransferase family 9 protein n=1 Tax=unclassified Beijerinckia TaxID=2638183 RepID=UPI000896361F|nr:MULTISPECIES: glycosyltransferase family 9 protein [unclassified Beijerinckia]MDH7797804.1 ADP-heptose:LPS heptosyltransferase/tetratricopeptide (TPR) repeat protein [Beijerinckia sp. GAS462]SEC99138.1 ADP-heptose:LPS heptosyltransferase [Beijerinckia sp. 28-YEA-48]